MFSSSLRAIVLLLAAVELAVAVPSSPSYTQHSTHVTRSLPNGFTIKTYHPKAQFEVFERGVEHQLSRRDLQSERPQYQNTGLDFVRSKFASDDDDDDMDVTSAYEGVHASHVWLRQRYAGIPVANTLANVALNSKGDILSYSSNFVKTVKKGNGFAAPKKPNTTAKLTPEEAAAHAIKTLGGKTDSRRKPELNFLAVEDGDLVLTHSVRMAIDGGHVIEAYVDAQDGEVRGLVDYTADLSMRVVPITKRDPTEGHVLVNDPEDKEASPTGWNNAGGDIYQATVGNNVIASPGDVTKLEIDQLIALAANTSSKDTFDYKYDPYADPSKGDNLAAATVNAWFVANTAHDILYRYGFTEKAFNFQDGNDKKGGKDGDIVFLSVQDKSDTNNANFVTLPDGEPGVMRMYLWDAFNPMRDGDMANSVVLHEYTHGLTNRLTGGGTAQCLQSTESRGLGEGWSDAFADWVWQTGNTHVVDFAIGTYVTGTPGGIREHPYSHNDKVNPLKYQDVKGRQEEHTIGEVWAQTLHNVLAVLVSKLGAGSDARTNPDGENGHATFLHLFVDSLAIQPCNPTFVDARLAWIQADQNRYQGKNKCTLWLAFAYMGLGEGADNYMNSHKVPKECKQ